MSVQAIIRLAPILRVDDLDELRRRGRTVYDFHTFKPLRPDRPVPVCVDHDDVENVVGVVRQFDYREAPEGGHWCFVHCRIDDPPPWLRRGTGCSFGSILRRTLDMGGGLERVIAMRVEEVTICSPASVPLEPLSRVEWIGDSPVTRKPAAGTRAHGPAVGVIGLDRPGTIVRPNSGVVLGLR